MAIRAASIRMLVSIRKKQLQSQFLRLRFWYRFWNIKSLWLSWCRCWRQRSPVFLNHIRGSRNFALRSSKRISSVATIPIRTCFTRRLKKNIANKQKLIDKAYAKIAELRTKRTELDKAIADEESKILHESDLLATFQKRLEEAKERQALVETPAGSPPCTLDKIPGQPVLREWIRLLYPDAYSVYEANNWETPVIRSQADRFIQWSAALGAVNTFALYAATRTADQVDSGEATEARKCLETIACDTRLHALATGQARRACELFAGGDHPTVPPFSAECPMLQEWCRPYKTDFKAGVLPKQRPSASPYWRPEPEKPDEPLRPIEIKGEFKDEHWTEARRIIKALHADVHKEDFPFATCTPPSEVHAAQLFCIAVVENEQHIAQIPKFSEYMATVKEGGGIKRVGEPLEDLEKERGSAAAAAQ